MKVWRFRFLPCDSRVRDYRPMWFISASLGIGQSEPCHCKCPGKPGPVHRDGLLQPAALSGDTGFATMGCLQSEPTVSANYRGFGQPGWGGKMRRGRGRHILGLGRDPARG